MGTYKEAFRSLVNGLKANDLLDYVFYDFSNKSFSPNAQSRICHLSLAGESEYNKNALLMIFTIGKNVNRVVIQSEGERTVNPSSTYPQKTEALELARKNHWKYIALAISSDDFENPVIRDYVVSIESTSYAKATVCVLDDCITYLKDNNLPAFYRCRKKASDNVEYTLSFIKKANFLDYLKYTDPRTFDDVRPGIDADANSSVAEAVNPSRARGGYNKIFYGAPGCGKSYLVNKRLNDAGVPEENRIRVTFHPEYANCDFVGQILPTIETRINGTTGEEEEIVKYVFNPGPFTLAIKRARQTNDMVYLIIEEINRGNAAAIFGDLFQLLDRVRDPEKPNFGESEYPICNVNVQKYLGIGEDGKLVIPSNVTILATMNTSDQNVFTMDTAFKRRWASEQISNNIKDDTEHKYKAYYIPGTDVTLERFLTVINREILNHKITSEDKRMGKYFVAKDCLTAAVRDIADVKAEAEMFAYKVLEYIWNDVCKIDKEDWFDTSAYQTLEDVIEAFVHPKNGENPLSVFKSITF